MNFLVNILTKLGLLKDDLDYHLVRASMVILFLFFGYQKWFEYEAQTLILISATARLFFGCTRFSASAGPVGFWGFRSGCSARSCSQGFWNKKLGILGALGAVASFMGTVTIIPFMPGGWAASAGGFPAMTGNVPFLMKDVVLLAVSIYLLKQDVMRVSLSAERVVPDRLERIGRQRERGAA